MRRRAAQAGSTPLVLKPSPLLREDIPQPTRDQLPTYLSGEHIFGRPDLETVIEGDAQLRRGDTVDPRRPAGVLPAR